MNKWNSALLIMLLFWSLPALSELRLPELPSKNKPLAFEMQTEFFRTHSNYTSLGGYVDLPEENYLQYFAFHPSLSYSPFSHYINFKIFANSFYVFSNSKGTKRSVFRPKVVGSSMSIYHKIQNLYIAGELRGGLPILKNHPNTNDLIVGEDSYFVEPGLWLLFQPSPLFYIHLNTAFEWRFLNGLSSLVHGQIGGTFQTEYLDAGVSINSFVSVIPDYFSSQPDTRLNPLRKVNGGSYKFSALNPSALSWMGWMEVKYKPFFTKLYFNMDTIGINYAKGFTFGLVKKIKWNTKSLSINKRHMKFDFGEEESEDFSDSESKYFEEEKDPYDKGELNKELHEELYELKN